MLNFAGGHLHTLSGLMRPLHIVQVHILKALGFRETGSFIKEKGSRSLQVTNLEWFLIFFRAPVGRFATQMSRTALKLGRI